MGKILAISRVVLASAVLLSVRSNAQVQIDYPTQVARKPMSDLREYQFTRTNNFTGNFGASGNLSSAGAGKTITLTPCPKGLAGTDTGHYVYISGGTGTAEPAPITGGTCTPALATGTIIITTANTHTGNWNVSSATAGLKEACEVLGSVHVPFGTYVINSPVVCNNPTIIEGVGMGDSILACSASFTGQMFPPTGTGEGYKWSNLTLDMTLCPSADAISLTAQTVRPVIESVRVIYAGTATGKALNMASVSEVHVNNFITNNPGYCIDIQGDNAGGPGTEHFFGNVVCDSPNTYGFRVSRTTVDDVGAYYLSSVKINNPSLHSGGGFLFTSTVANTATVVFCTLCIADNILGAPALDINNGDTMHFNTSWFTSGVSSYSAGHAAIRIRGTTTEVNFSDVQAMGRADGLSLGDTPTSIRWIGGKLSGVALACAVGASCAIHIDSGATLGNFDLRAPIIDAPPYTDQPTKLMLSGPQQLLYTGGFVPVLNNQGTDQTFCIKDVTVGHAATGLKCWGINNVGDLELRNSANQDVLTINEAGILSLVKATSNQLLIGDSAHTTTVNFPAPSGANVALTFPNTTDVMVGRVTTEELKNKIIRIKNGVGYIQWYKSDDTTRLAYMGTSNTDLPIELENGARFIVNGGDAIVNGGFQANGVNITSLTASRPLRADSGKDIVSGQIDLSSTNDISGTLAIAHGGTGATTAAGARSSLGVPDASTTYTKSEVDAMIAGLQSQIDAHTTYISTLFANDSSQDTSLSDLSANKADRGASTSTVMGHAHTQQ